MKALIINALTMVALLCVSVACAPSNDPDENTSKTTTLTLEACDALPARGGQHTISYTLTNPVEGAEWSFSEPTAEWLHDVRLDAESSRITFAYDRNSSEEPREASFTVAYSTLDPISVVVTQNAHADEFTVTLTNATTNSVDVTCVAADPTMRFVLGKLSAATLSEFPDKEAWAEYYISDRSEYWYETSTFVGMFPSEGLDDTITFYSHNLPGYIVVFGLSYEGNWENVQIATDIYLYEPELLPTPTVVITPTEQHVSHLAGEVTFDYSIESPLEGESLVAEASASWLNATVTENSVVVAYEANPTTKSRSAEVVCSYEGVEPITLLIEQEGDADATPITFDLAIVESHYDHILVNVTPSDASVKYAIGAVSKSDFAKYYNNTDEILTQDLLSTYYKPAIISGAQSNYAVEVEASDITDWEWYIYAYAVNDSEDVAISDVTKLLVEVVDDTPILNFDPERIEVAGEGGKYTVKYTLTNGRPEGTVKFFQNPMDYYDILKPDSWTIDTEKCEVSFEVNPYNELKFGHDAVIFIAYFPTEDSIYADASASLNIIQLAPAQ